jgi:hypothetical protein
VVTVSVVTTSGPWLVAPRHLCAGAIRRAGSEENKASFAPDFMIFKILAGSRGIPVQLVYRW